MGSRRTEGQEGTQQCLSTQRSHSTLQCQACGSGTETGVCGTAFALVHPPKASHCLLLQHLDHSGGFYSFWVHQKSHWDATTTYLRGG